MGTWWRPSRHARVVLLLAFALMCAGCGGGDDGAAASTTSIPSGAPSTPAPTTTAQAATTTSAPTTTPTSAPTTTSATTTTTSPTTTSAATSTTLPGELIDFGPRPGDVLGVVGVRHDDVLNVRSAPGVAYPIVATLAPTADDVAARGVTRQIPGALWIEVVAGGITGWVNLRYVAYLGETTDETAAIVARLGRTPAAETMLDLGLIVATAASSTDPPSNSRRQRRPDALAIWARSRTTSSGSATTPRSASACTSSGSRRQAARVSS